LEDELTFAESKGGARAGCSSSLLFGGLRSVVFQLAFICSGGAAGAWEGNLSVCFRFRVVGGVNGSEVFSLLLVDFLRAGRGHGTKVAKDISWGLELALVGACNGMTRAASIQVVVPVYNIGGAGICLGVGLV